MNQTPDIKRRIPQRTCVACRKVMPKRDLNRLVKTPGGEIQIDPGGRLPGRGAYLCSQCLKEGLRVKNLGYALKTTVTESDIARLAKSFI
jgi:uncharacterized protein